MEGGIMTRINKRLNVLLISILLIVILFLAIPMQSYNSSFVFGEPESNRSVRSMDKVDLEKDWITQIGPIEGMALGDIDNDGFLDLAVVGNGVKIRVFKNFNGTMLKSPFWESNGIYYATCAAWGDMDNDGYLELAVGCAHDSNSSRRLNIVFKNFGGDLGGNPTWYSPDKRDTSDILWADIDNDNDLDLAACNFGNNSNNVIYENRDKTLKNQPLWTSTEQFWSEGIACGDVDNDNDLDLIVGNNFDDPNQIYYNAGTALETSATWTSDDSTKVLDVCLGDLDGDGDLDLVAGTNDPNMCIAYYNLGSSFPNVFSWSLSGSYQCTSVDLGDVDSDGDLDLALGCKNNWGRANNYIYLNRNNTLDLNYSWESNDNAGTTEMVFGDVDMDGDLDLVVMNNLTMDSAWIYTNNADKLPEKLDNLPNNHPYCSITTPEGIKSGTIKLNFTLYDNENNMVIGIFEYSINDGPWKTATQWTGPEWCDINNLTTTKAGKQYKFNWDTNSIKTESNNVMFRILIFEKNNKIASYQYSAVIAKTKVFGLGTPPSMPAGLSVSSITIDSLVLSWAGNPTTELVLGYDIYINKTDSTNEFEHYSTVEDVNSLKVTNLVENTSYYFKVQAYDCVPFRSEFTKRISARTYNNPPQVKPGFVPIKIIIPEDGEDVSSLNLNEIFYDTTGDPLKFGYQASKNFTISINNGGEVTIKPVTDWFGTELIKFKANDSMNHQHPPTAKSVASFEQEVLVEGINDMPKILRELGTVNIDEDQKNVTSLNLLTYFDDSIDEDKLKFRIVGQKNLTVKIAMASYLEIELKKNWYGTEYLTIYASDNIEEVEDTLKVVVHPVNDPPEIKTSSFYWQPGKWVNATIDIEDVDVDDKLHVSTNIQEVLPDLMPNENYNFNPANGELSLKPTNKMAGTYKINVTVNDGTVEVTKAITITIATSGDTTTEGGGEKEKLDLVTYVVIPIIVIVVIIIVIFFIFTTMKKKQKISFIKCPGCNQSVVRRGKGTFNCDKCGTEIDPNKIASASQALPPPERVSQPATTSSDPGPLTQKVSGGYYPKSILSGSFLDDTDFEPTHAPSTEEAPKEKQNVPMAVPIAALPPQPTPAQPTAQAQATPVQATAQAQPAASARAATPAQPAAQVKPEQQTQAPQAAPATADPSVTVKAQAQPKPQTQTQQQTGTDKKNTVNA
jgi:hypothetical protein